MSHIYPPEVLGLLQQGLQFHNAARLDDAAMCYQRALARQPDNPDALHLLGLVALQNGHYHRAVEHIERALARRDFPPFRNNCGEAHRALGQLDRAEAQYRAALRGNPDFPEALNNLGLTLDALGRGSEAMECFRSALALNPRYAQAHNNLGLALLRTDASGEALAHFERALEIDPGLYQAAGNLGQVRERAGQFDAAVDAYRQAIAAQPGYIEAYGHLAQLLTRLERFDEARACLGAGLANAPDHPALINCMGSLYYEQEAYDQALGWHLRASRLSPGYAEAHRSAGMAYRALGQLSQAIGEYRAAVAADPANAQAHFGLAFCLLMAGDYRAGWEEFEWRWQVDGHQQPVPEALRWDGSSLRGKRLLVLTEQGVGDVVQFARYLPLLAEGGARVQVACSGPVAPLVASVPGIAGVVADIAQGDFDAAVPLLSLPRLFGTTPQTIPDRVPYLAVDPSRRAAWRDRVGEEGLRVGIAWTGNAAHRNNRARSCPLPLWSTLFGLPGLEFHSLCKLDNPPSGDWPVRDHSPHLRDFADTAALIDALDLVISVDTSPAHVAGALGKPVWLLLPHSPDWRWFADRDDSPWYPSMRIFRQPRPGDWGAVMNAAASALAGMQR